MLLDNCFDFTKSLCEGSPYFFTLQLLRHKNEHVDSGRFPCFSFEFSRTDLRVSAEGDLAFIGHIDCSHVLNRQTMFVSLFIG